MLLNGLKEGHREIGVHPHRREPEGRNALDALLTILANAYEYGSVVSGYLPYHIRSGWTNGVAC